jgi:hypothetical protein
MVGVSSLKPIIMKPLIYLFTAAVLFTATSCKKETVKPSIKDKLIGKWKFEVLTGGLPAMYVVAVPSQVDVIEFKKDQSFVRSTNGEEGATGTFEIYQSVSIFSGQKDNTLRYTPQHGQPSIINIVGDTLRLSENVEDGFNIKYSRVK